MDLEELRQSAQRRSNLQRQLSTNQSNYSTVYTSLFTTEEDIKSYIKKSHSLMLSYRCNINEFISNILQYLQNHGELSFDDDNDLNELLSIFTVHSFSIALSKYKNLLETDSLLKKSIYSYSLEIYEKCYKKWSGVTDEIPFTGNKVNKKEKASEGLFTLYSCDKCNAPIKDINDLDDHYIICSKTTYKCYLCGIELDSKLSLGPHLTICPNYLVKRSAACLNPDVYGYSNDDEIFIQRNSYHSDSNEEYKKNSSIDIILSNEFMNNICKNCSERGVDMSEHECPHYDQFVPPSFHPFIC